MANDHKALRLQGTNLEHGIQTINGAQAHMSQDLRSFMQQMGPLLALAQQQPHTPPQEGPLPLPPPRSPAPWRPAPLPPPPTAPQGR